MQPFVVLRDLRAGLITRQQVNDLAWSVRLLFPDAIAGD